MKPLGPDASSRRTLPVAALVLSTSFAIFASACGDKSSPTQPLTPTPAPMPTSRDAVVVSVTLTKLDPPAGVKHAVLAAFVVREAQGRAVQLNNVKAYNYAGAVLAVTGFTSQVLPPGGSARFDVTVTSADDIPCADELYILVNFDNGLQRGGKGGFYDCTTGAWLF